MAATLQNALRLLSDAAPDRRSQEIAVLGVDTLREAWSASNDAADLALVILLLAPRAVATRGLAACIQATMSSHVERDPRVSTMMKAAESLASGDCSKEDAERIFAGIGELPELDSLAWVAHAALANFYKYLYEDTKRGVEGVVFFCAEGAMSKEHRTWDSAMGWVAHLFRSAVPNPFDTNQIPWGG